MILILNYFRCNFIEFELIWTFKSYLIQTIFPHISKALAIILSFDFDFDLIEPGELAKC